MTAVDSAALDRRPLIAHILYRFDVGGLENGVVNLINQLPASRYRHAIVALTCVTDFRQRIVRSDVQFHALDKQPGHGVWLWPQMVRLLRQIRPTVVHTRNLAALEMVPAAAWAGVPVRVHGEHGWDVQDPDGTRRRFGWMRKMYRPFVHHFVALSRHQAAYLTERVGVPAVHLSQIYNGVDLRRFVDHGARQVLAGAPPFGSDEWVIGTVGRLQPIKNQLLLARAFIRARELSSAARKHLRLVIVGGGPDATQIEAVLSAAGAREATWMAGERSDVAEVMRALDCFVLPSRAEGISNTILEAMASGLPIIATDVGGNGELLEDGVTGRLIASDDVDAMAQALLDDFSNKDAARGRGQRARAAVQSRFGLDRMVSAYADLYDRLIGAAAAHDHNAEMQQPTR
jgi:sugar transferase (PEP-CTERM/EpsH1 system associated)